MKLNLGSGYRKIDGHINIDNRECVSPDMVADLSYGMPFKDNSVDLVQAFDFLEHLEREDVYNLVNDIWRILRPAGKFLHRTPSDRGMGAWMDPTHRSAWNINTWKFYFVDPAYRELYNTRAHFSIIYLYDEWTDKANNIIHTHCGYKAIK